MKRAQILFGGLAIGVLSSPGASAQSTGNEARAQTLFEAAKQLRDGGQIADACPMFAESKELAPGVGVTLHLADCYERMGRTASAWDQFRQAETLARERGDDKRADVARARARVLEPRLDRLTLAASSAPHPSWQVLLDDAEIPASMWNASLAVDPGDHVVTVRAPGQPPRMSRVHLDAPSPSATVRVDDAAEGGSPEPTAPVRAGGVDRTGGTGGSAASSGGASARLWWGLGLVAVGVAGAGLGVAFLAKRNQLINDGGPCDTPRNEDDTATAATIAFAAGGAALVSALVLALSAPDAPPGGATQVGWTLAPAPLPGGAGGGLSVRGRF